MYYRVDKHAFGHLCLRLILGECRQLGKSENYFCSFRKHACHYFLSEKWSFIPFRAFSSSYTQVWIILVSQQAPTEHQAPACFGGNAEFPVSPPRLLASLTTFPFSALSAWLTFLPSYPQSASPSVSGVLLVCMFLVCASSVCFVTSTNSLESPQKFLFTSSSQLPPLPFCIQKTRLPQLKKNNILKAP